MFILLGGEPGTWTARVDAVLASDAIDANTSADNERTAAITKAREEYLAVLFIHNCDPCKYGKRVSDLKVRFIEGNGGDPYPTTLAKALEMLDTWEEINKMTRRRSSTEETRIAFTTNYDHIGDSQSYSSRGRGRCGSGRGCSNGRGSHGNGRRYRDRGAFHQNEAHHLDDDEGQNDHGIFENEVSHV